ncbi:MAG TPA: AAA family ATPase [Gallionella sp.]|nr:AAA family ATPase [Gallionella sp.]
MYLEHFGLNEPPFRITPVTVFFFSGANRGEILDALIYSLSESEGIIKVSGEVGSGKTMLCRMLLERLPKHVETIYLANPSLSREEMLYAIADALGLSIDGKRVGIIIHSIQNRLEEKAREGKRIVVLVDEAHAMPLDTLEELRLLYNLQIGNTKLLQIILFGQPELNTKLDQPNMRQLKDRIIHHFHIQPLSRNTLENYLAFRMRTAGYRGPDIFSPKAIKLIADASNGLMRRINILADKSLLAAFVEDTHNIETHHVQAAMRDSELKPARSLPDKKLLMAGAAGALLLTGLAAWWLLDKPPVLLQQATSTSSGQTQDKSPAHAPAQPSPAVTVQSDNAPTPEINKKTNPATITSSLASLSQPTTDNPAQVATSTTNSSLATGKAGLFEQRLAAGKQLLEQKKAVASIQLFYSEEIKQERIESFLRRANGLGKLPEIYLLPSRFGGKDGLRVLYGAYPSANAAHNAINELPTRYKNAFTVSVYTF